MDNRTNLAERQRIDQICDRFEQAWQSANEDNPPSLAEQIDNEIEDQDELLTQLLALDVAYRRQFSISLTEDTYRQTFPRAGNAIDRVFGSAVDVETVDELQQSDYTPSVGGGVGIGEVSRTEEPLPTQLGRYECIRKLGKGGFGMVVLAKDTELNRQVAIKFARSELRGNERATTFFLNEARTVAELDHPHIAPIYDVGRTDDGSPYFVMKYYPNGDLRSWDPADVDSNEVARKFAGLASALAAAHQRGIVHRDIKPSNILVGDDGELCLVDFGLALKGDADPTAAAFAGTPNYMSPEQATDGVAIDARSDLFSLGVVLYERLANQLPYPIPTESKVPNFEKRLATVRSLNPKVKPRIDAICQHMLATDRKSRYSSASDVTDNLRDAVATKWARRFGIAIASLLAFGICSVGVVRWKALQTERRLAAQSAELADFMVGILRSPDPSVDGRTVTVASRLEDAVIQARESLADQPLRQSNMLFSVGQSFAGLGLPDRALEVLQESERLLASQVHENDERLLDVQAHVAVAKQRQSDVKGAIVELTNIKQRWEANYKLDDLRYRFISGSLMEALRDDSQFEAAYEMAEQVLAQTKAAADPDELEELILERGCAEILTQLSRFDEATEKLNKALTRLRAREPRTRLEEMRTLAALAATQRAMNVDSVPAQVEALQIAQEVLGESHRETLDRIQGLAFAIAGSGGAVSDIPFKEKTVKELLQKRYRLALETLGTDHTTTLMAGVELARLLDDPGEAIAVLQENQPRFIKVFGETHIQTLSLEQVMANLLMKEKRFEEATAVLEDLIPRMELTFGENGKHVISTDFTLVHTLRFQNRNQQAATFAEKSAHRSEAFYGTEHAKTNTRYFAAIENYFAAGEYKKVVELGEYFIQHYSEISPGRVTTVRVFMAGALFELEQNDESLEMITVAMADPNFETDLQNYTSSFATSLRGKLLHEKGDIEKARELTKRGKEMFPTFENPGTFQFILDMGDKVTEWEKESAE